MEGDTGDIRVVKTCLYKSTKYEIVGEHGDTLVLKPLARKKVDGDGEYDEVVFADESEVQDIEDRKVHEVDRSSLKDDFIYRMMFNFCKVFLFNQKLIMDLSKSDRALKVPISDSGYDMNMFISLTKREEE